MRLFKRLYQFIISPRNLFIYCLAAIMVPNIVLCLTEHLSFTAILCNIILPGAVYSWLLTLRHRPGIMIWLLFPMIFLSAFEIVILYLFGSSIITTDMFLNVATTNLTEVNELLSNIMPAVAGVFVLYVPLLVLGIISIYRKDHLSTAFVYKTRFTSYIAMAVGFVFMVVSYVNDREYDFRKHLFPASVLYNLALSVERYYSFSQYPETSANFKYNAHSTHDAAQQEIYIFVIGETGRACNWGIYGYGRNTTPLLSARQGVVAFTDVLTQSNTTHISVPMLLSAASAENHDRIYREKSIITAFKEAGFYTAFLSNQRFNHSFIDLFGKEADTDIFLKEGVCDDTDIYDDRLLEYIDRLLDEGHKKLFIVLHTYGSHFNYNERYDENDAVFTPDRTDNVSADNRDCLINAYDNTVIQTDKFLNSIISRINGKDTVSAILYSSDHGEDIFDDSRDRFLHSSPTPTYYQLHIPFVIWLSDTYNVRYPEIIRNIRGNSKKPVSSNLSAFHTLLQISGIETSLRNDSFSVADSDYHIKRRFFINDHNDPVTYDNIGLTKEDLLQFKKHKIQM